MIVLNKIKPIVGKLKFYIWISLFVSKRTHKQRLKQAGRLLVVLNQPIFKNNPEKLFCYLRKIDPLTFEELILLCFKRRGLKVKHNAAYTGDGGVDGIVVLPDKTQWAIQAKRYQHHINPQHVADFAKAIVAQGFAGGWFVHTGKTGKFSYANLGGCVRLISGSKLHQLITTLE